MIVAVTGARGRLASCLVEKHGFLPLSADVTNREAVQQAIEEMRPDVIVNCAAVTDVDKAQDFAHESRVVEVNTKAPGYLRTAFDGYLVHMSTSFVFNGKHSLREERHKPYPINFYGMSKFGGECAAAMRGPTLVIRTEQLYGWRGKSFVAYAVSQLMAGNDLTLPADVIRTPTYIPHLAEAIADVIARPAERLTGILHLAGTDATSMLDWAKVIQHVWGLYGPRITKGPGRPEEAPRPRLGGLSTKYAKSLGLPLYGLREGLVACHNAGDLDDSTR